MMIFASLPEGIHRFIGLHSGNLLQFAIEAMAQL